MAKSIHQSELIFNLNSRLFHNALEGVTDEQGAVRLTDHNNSLNWLAAHTTWARYNACMILGKPAASNPYAGMFENFKPLDPNTAYPTVSETRTEWDKATALLKEVLAEVSEEHLAADCPLRSPIGDPSNAGTVAFFAQHESYDIGQIGFLKKYFTKDGMKY